MDQEYIDGLRAFGIRAEVVRHYKELLRIRDEFIVGNDGFRTGFLLLIGPHGTGKSSRFRDAKGVYYANDAVSAVGLFRMAWRHKNEALVLDDVDDLMSEKQAVALLKALGENGDPDGNKPLCWEKQNSGLEADGIPTKFMTASRICIICNELPKLNKNIRAVLDRAKIIVFWPTTEEIHGYVESWWPEEHRDITEFISQNLDRICSPSIRWYEDAKREKMLGNDWRNWLMHQWYSDNPRMAVIAALHKSEIPKGKAMEEEWHRRTGLGRALFYRMQQQYLAQREPTEAPPNPENP